MLTRKSSGGWTFDKAFTALAKNVAADFVSLVNSGLSSQRYPASADSNMETAFPRRLRSLSPSGWPFCARARASTMSSEGNRSSVSLSSRKNDVQNACAPHKAVVGEEKLWRRKSNFHLYQPCFSLPIQPLLLCPFIPQYIVVYNKFCCVPTIFG